jgi:hypothetical protein
MIKDIFTVHTVRPGDVGAVEIVFITEKEARAYARDRSTDFRVLASSVTRFTIAISVPDTRSPGSSAGRNSRTVNPDPETSTPRTAARSCDPYRDASQRLSAAAAAVRDPPGALWPRIAGEVRALADSVR